MEVSKKIEGFKERLDYLKTLEDGWYNGHGKKLDSVGAEWFCNKFVKTYDFAMLPVPTAFPIEDGRLQLELCSNDHDVTLEINLVTKSCEYHQYDFDTKLDEEDSFDLSLDSTWETINTKLKSLF